MKKNLLITILVCAFSITILKAQNVPNGGFENWTSGNPDGWQTSNIIGFATPITQTTPSYSGAYAVKGEVVASLGGPFPPFIISAGMGFPVSQAYSNLNFYYKQNHIGTATFNASVAMFQGTGNGVGGGGQFFSSTVTSFTLASIPIYYNTTNPDTCIITFSIGDTVAPDPAVGNNFIIDDVSLSGTAGVYDLPVVSPLVIEKVHPNPAREDAYIYYSLPSNSDLQFDLYDASGKKYFELKLTDETAGRHKVEFDASEIPAGFYILRMTSADGSAHYPLQVLH